MFFSALHYILRVDSATDCAWHASARAWVDANGDGLVDRDEPPLREIKIHVEEVENQIISVGAAGWSAVTDKDGDVQFNIPIPGCMDTTFAIHPDIPEGYHLTTSPRIQVNSGIWENLGPARIYYFGLAPNR